MKHLLLLLLLLAEAPALAQSTETLQVRLDSLKGVHALLQSRLSETEAQIASIQKEIDRRVFQEASTGGISVTIRKDVDIVERPRSGPVVKRLSEGMQVVVTDVDGSYLRVGHEGQFGWISDLWVHQTEDLKKYREMKIAMRVAEPDEHELALLAKITELKKSGRPVLITEAYTTGPNSADGVGYWIEFLLANNKPIKYIRSTVRPYNSVGDLRSSRIGGYSTHSLEVVGPWDPDYGHSGISTDVAWYNAQISCIEITRLELEYADGSKHIFVNDLPKILGDGVSNDCSYTP